MSVWTPKTDAIYAHTVESWDSPFTALEGDVASNGLRLDVREPTSAYPWSGGASSFVGQVQAATAANLFTAFTNASYSFELVSDGRTPNLVEYWSAGTPNWYGGSQRGRVALHYRLYLRPVAGRSWFATGSSVELSLAFAGNGYVRVTKTISGATTDVNVGGTVGFNLTEADWLNQGYRFTSAVTLAAGDYLDVYYIQDRQDWGGLVAKAVLGSTQTQALATAAPVVGCGLFDTGTQPTKRTWGHVKSAQIQVDAGQSRQATLSLTLVNPDVHDGFGWEWRQDTADDPGYLAYWDGAVEQFTVKRGRLVRVKCGYDGEQEIVFTGIIQDLPHPRNGLAQVRLLGFEHRLIESRNKLEPDPVSYMLAGYRKVTGVLEPVYGVTAYDAWTIEDAVADMNYRAGIDASRMRQPLKVRKADGSLVAVQYGSDAFLKFRARSKQGTLLRLERPAHYGNVGTQFSESKPVDDPYLFPPEARDDSWARVLEIADRYGYDIRFDAVGDLVLSTRANACFAYDIVAGDSAQSSTRKTHPSAYKGTYQEWAVAPTITKLVVGARIDVSLPRGASLGSWSSIIVTRDSDSAVMATHNSVAVTAASDVFYYDYRTTTDGSNATILTLFSGDYDTYLVEFIGTGDATRRLDALFVYHTDPDAAKYALSTEEVAFEIDPQDAGDEMRNIITVVGTRKATVTDSEKLKSNPNNPEQEFIVEVATDPASVTDPTAPNYVGMRKEATIIDSSISDQDYAAYLARTMVYRFRTPRPPAEISHILIAELDLRACVTADEVTFQTVRPISKLWVTGFTHSINENGDYSTIIRTSAWPEFPSYEPRDDIDIDADFAGVPVANVAVQYTSCSGHVKTNLPSSGVARDSRSLSSASGGDIVEFSAITPTGGSPDYLAPTTPPWPPVPGTVMIRPSLSGGGFTHVTEEYPSAGSSGWVLKGSSGSSHPMRIQISLQGTAKVPVTNVWYIVWSRDPDDTTPTYLPPAMGMIKSAESVLLAASAWNYNQDENVLTVNIPAFAFRIGQEISIKVEYDKYAAGVSTAWRANTPYHHFINVDYRDSNRRIYLPWKEGTGSSPYVRPETVTAWDVRYRKLGVVDGGGAYAVSYPDGSPFYDVTTSELGYLISLAFDALVSGQYRISVRSAFDHTTVAWLTEPTADPQEPEAHWQYLTAGAGRSFNWDGIDQIGTWNRKQSEDYSALSQGWFEDEAKQVVSSGWYVWNRERQAGVPGPLALISDARNADGSPVYGQGTWGMWYFHIEVANETLAAKAEADPTKKYPRVARTIDPAAGEQPPTYTTGNDFSRDTFGDTDNTLLQSHTGQLNATWAKLVETGDAQVSDAGRLHASSGTAAMYYTSGAPSLADYDVSAVVRARSATAGTAGVCGRMSTTVATYYEARYNDNDNEWQLLKSVAGTVTPLGTDVSATLTVDTDYRLTLRMRGSTIQLLVDGVVLISVTDTDITLAGRAGVRFSGAGGSDTTGLHLDTFVAGGTNAAVVYTHMPAPAKLELEVADWIEGTAFDANNAEHLSNENHWQAPWYNSDLGLSTVSTGSTSLSATSTGYERAAGSFVTDGFMIGMHVSASGFGEFENNGWSVVTAVSALVLTVTKAPHQTVTEGASAGRTIAISFEGILNNQRPVRVRFRLAARPGTLWGGKDGEAQVKLTRHVHAKILINDQFVIGEGTNWTGTSTEQRTVVSRRLHNDDHTVTFVDEGWRHAKTLKHSGNLTGVTEWVFRPQDFKKDFGRGVEDESIQFGDYLQVEEVPSWESQLTIAGKHSRLIASFMAYLFYLSAYCVDRTGRRVWGVNRKFVDRFKIPANAYGDWWDPANPTTAATNSTFQAELVPDPVRQQRRSVVCRQWSREGTWHTDQRSRWTMSAGTVGDKLLTHFWRDHEPTTTTLHGVPWPTLDEDKHSKWHRDGRTDLPAAFTSLTRQLGSYLLGADGNVLTHFGTGASRWLWESDPYWIPCVTRDFHPYYFVPPMPDPTNEDTQANTYWYSVVDITAKNVTANTGRDVAASPTWYSWARDMSRTYESGGAGKVRFWPGTKTDTTKGMAAGGVEADSIDYVRQDQTVHYEDLRGAYSRDKRPGEGVRKIIPSPPYYINQIGYSAVAATAARGQSALERRFPRFSATVSEWFRLAFRSEYLWESSTLFPVDYAGREKLEHSNVWVSRFIGGPLGVPTVWQGQAVTYDGGSWVGWKDDTASAFSQSNVFTTGWTPMDVGPKGPSTADVYMHLVLANERRRQPI